MYSFFIKKGGGEKLKKKIVDIFVSLLILAILTTPLVGSVMAGKGQTRVSFKLVLVGTYGGPGEQKVAGKSTHITDMPFMATGWMAGEPPYDISYAPLLLEIDGIAVDPARLGYEGMMKVIWSEHPDGESGQPNIVIQVDENITISGDNEGKLVLQVKGNNYATGNGMGAGDSFIGFGTDDFEGVKIKGTTPDGAVTVGEIDLGGGDTLPISKLERIGTIMGWPEMP